jgi:hypothetical protein
MRLFTLSELLRLPRPELLAMKQEIEVHLVEGACDRQIALANLRLIDRILARFERLIR